MEQQQGDNLQELQLLQKKVAELTETLRIKNKQLLNAEKMSLLGQLTAGIAHEINTPLGALKSNYDFFIRSISRIRSIVLKADSPLTRAEQEELETLFNSIDQLNSVNKNASQRIVDIVNGVRRFARQDKSEPVKADLNDLIESTLPILHHELKHRIQVRREYGHIPPVECFPGRISQVFLNLVVNASHAIDTNGEIFIKTDNREDRVIVEIRDTGKGILAEDLERIFEKGFTTKGTEKGMGMGLALVKQMVEDHQGEIEVSSELASGTTFRIILPVNQNG